MTDSEKDLLGSAIDFAEKKAAPPGQAVITYGKDKFLVLYVFKKAYGFRVFRDREAAEEEANSPSIHI